MKRICLFQEHQTNQTRNRKVYVIKGFSTNLLFHVEKSIEFTVNTLIIRE